jgi:hypothetical protein
VGVMVRLPEEGALPHALPESVAGCDRGAVALPNGEDEGAPVPDGAPLRESGAEVEGAPLSDPGGEGEGGALWQALKVGAEVDEPGVVTVPPAREGEGCPEKDGGLLLDGGVDADCMPLCDFWAVSEGGALRDELEDPQREAEERALAPALLESAGECDAAV